MGHCHPYLSDTACIYRLVDEYKQHGSLVIAYDFDNCVYDYHSKGHCYCEVVNILREAKKIGCHLIVFTAEKDTEKVKNFLTEQKIPFDGINENPPFFKSDARKIYYNILLDDRAGLWSAYYQLEQTIQIIKHKI
jgi:hypothetical protein